MPEAPGALTGARQPRKPWPTGQCELSTSMAMACARVVGKFWKHTVFADRQQWAKELTVLDVAPPQAGTLRVLLRTLGEELQAIKGHATTPLRYLACMPDEEAVRALHDLPELRPWIDAGILIALPCDIRFGMPQKQAERSATPPVVLAFDAWSRMEQRLLAIHYGKLLKANPDPADSSEAPAADGWTTLDPEEGGQALDCVLPGYRARLNSAPIVLPTGALRLIDWLDEWAPSGYLMLAHDSGHATEQSLQASDFEGLLSDCRKRVPLPVNFDLLAKHLRSRGAAIWQREWAPTRVVQIALATNDDDPQRALDDVTVQLRAEPFEDPRVLAQIMKTVASFGDSEQALAILRHAHHDPAVLIASGPALQDRLTDPCCDRRAWAEALSRTWDNHVPLPGQRDLHTQLVTAAMSVGAWGLARRALRRGIDVHGKTADDLARWARCETMTGRLRLAREIVEQALALDSANAQAHDVVQRLQLKSCGVDGEWRQCIAQAGAALVLEPIDGAHADALLKQYRDPQIAVMVQLPRLDSIGAARRWINESMRAGQRHRYAVMHEDFGFVGYVSLLVSGSNAHFSFWTGTDYQGRGWGADAGALLCRFAEERGVDRVFASAFDDNIRSIRALERIGFKKLRLKGNAADPRTFLCRSSFDMASNEAALIKDRQDAFTDHTDIGAGRC